MKTLRHVDDLEPELVALGGLPPSGGEFRLEVAEGQRAVLLADGRPLEVLLPGEHLLGPERLGIAGDAPPAEVALRTLFLSTASFEFRWGTPEPLAGGAAGRGVRAWGTSRVRVADPARFAEQVSARGLARTAQVEDLCRAETLGALAETLQGEPTSAAGRAREPGLLAADVSEGLSRRLAPLGLELEALEVGGLVAG